MMTACMDDDWDNPGKTTAETFGNNAIEETNVVTIKELTDTYKSTLSQQYGLTAIGKDVKIKGRVLGNDIEGNVYSKVVIDDGTGAIIISVGEGGIFAYLPVGQEILVNLRGLYIGGYSETPQIGYPTEKYSSTVYRMSFMSRYTWYQHFKAVGRPDVTRVPDAVELTDAMYDETLNVSRLVYVDGHFASNDGNTKIADPNKVENKDTGNGVNETFVADKCSTSIIVRTSTYADFAAELIPATDVRLFGIMTRDSYKKRFQIQLRNADDIRIFCPGCSEYIGSTKWTRDDNGNYVCVKCRSVVAKS